LKSNGTTVDNMQQAQQREPVSRGNGGYAAPQVWFAASWTPGPAGFSLRFSLDSGRGQEGRNPGPVNCRAMRRAESIARSGPVTAMGLYGRSRERICSGKRATGTGTRARAEGFWGRLWPVPVQATSDSRYIYCSYCVRRNERMIPAVIAAVSED